MKKEAVIFFLSLIMDLNKKSLDVLLCLARFLGILPYKWKKSTREDLSFQSVITLKYISERLLLAALISILHIKFRMYDKISSEASFQIVVYVGCSTAILTLSIGIVFISTAIYGKNLVKQTIFFPKKLAAINQTSDKRFLSESVNLFAQAIYITIVVIVTIALGSFEYAPWQFLPNICIDIYTELITHIWSFSYFNHLLRLRVAFEDLYAASLVDDLNVAALKQCWSRYLYLRGVVVRINRIQGLNAIFCVAFIYVWQLFNLYTFLVELQKDDPDKMVAVTQLIWISIQSVKFFVFIYQAPKCASLIRKFRMRLANYSSEENHIEEVGGCRC